MNSADRTRLAATVGMVFAAGGLILSGLLICKHGFPELCASSWGCSTTDGVDGCAQLAQSSYSKILGIPIAIPGFFFFALLAAMFWRVREGATFALTLILATLLVFGTVFDAVLGYINFSVMVVPCKLCAYSYIAMGGSLICGGLLYFWHSQREISMSTFTSALKRLILPGTLSAGLTMALFLVFFVASSASSQRKEKKGGLLPQDTVTSTLSEFRQLNKVEMKTDGLTLVDGKDSAYIVVHEFADFRCPHCYHAVEILKQAMERWPGRIRIYYRQFPLDGNCNPAVSRKQEGAFSCNGTQAALCAPAQNIGPQMVHGIFDFQASEKNISLGELRALTQSLGGNWQTLVSCMTSAGTSAALTRDLRDADLIKIHSTPTLVVQDRLLPAGTPDPQWFFHLTDALVFEKEGVAAYSEYEGRAQK